MKMGPADVNSVEGGEPRTRLGRCNDLAGKVDTSESFLCPRGTFGTKIWCPIVARTFLELRPSRAFHTSIQTLIRTGARQPQRAGATYIRFLTNKCKGQQGNLYSSREATGAVYDSSAKKKSLHVGYLQAQSQEHAVVPIRQLISEACPTPSRTWLGFPEDEGAFKSCYQNWSIAHWENLTA